MAYATQTQVIAHLGFADRISAMAIAFRANRARRKIYTQTIRELSSLTNRELSDLGIGRGEIRTLAKEAAYKL